MIKKLTLSDMYSLNNCETSLILNQSELLKIKKINK